MWQVKDVYYNASPAVLYEQALRHEEGTSPEPTTVGA